MAATSIGLSLAISLAMDLVLLSDASTVATVTVIATIMFNVTVILLSGVGTMIEWRRPGHAIGRLLMLSGPLYAFLGMAWLTEDVLKPLLDPGVFRLVFWSSSLLSWPGVALVVAWIPMLFPTGSLPGLRWRIPPISLGAIFGVGLLALATVSRPTVDGTEPVSPPELVNAVAVGLLAQVVLATATVLARYRRGGQVERLQIRWFGTAVAAGILAVPITIGVAVTRYRLYELDRLVSRTIGWAVVTGILVVVFAGGVVALQALLEPVTSEDTLAVAASTLVAFALFQPVRRRVQRAVDHRFDRARYDGERVAATFAERLRGQADLEGVERDLGATVGAALSPASAVVWLRGDR